MAVQNPAADYRIVGGVVDLLLYYYLGLTFLESYGFVSIISGTTTNLQHHRIDKFIFIQTPFQQEYFIISYFCHDNSSNQSLSSRFCSDSKEKLALSR